jgi:hypothetical protein
VGSQASSRFNPAHPREVYVHQDHVPARGRPEAHYAFNLINRGLGGTVTGVAPKARRVIEKCLKAASIERIVFDDNYVQVHKDLPGHPGPFRQFVREH